MVAPHFVKWQVKKHWNNADEKTTEKALDSGQA